MKNEINFDDSRSSAEKINYLVRPAKQIERKLIVETLRLLIKMYNINKYQYVGMGSLFYVDYKMFHKYLGIKSMISIEKEKDKIDRFKFNMPYSFIDIIPGISTEILPTLNWNKDLFIWLDYDMPLCKGIINDIKIITNYIKPGGILIITVDSEVKRFDSEFDSNVTTEKQNRFNNFIENLHPHYPSDISLKDLTEKKYTQLIHRILSNIVKENLSHRKLDFHQIFNFKYKDSCKMYTYGCLFENDNKKLNDTGIYDLDFISTDSNIIDINVPILTPLEKLHLDKLIPDIKSNFSEFKLDNKKLEDYERYYKFYPQYFETYL